MVLDYAGIRVTNLSRSVRFYTRQLGLVELNRGRMHHGGVWVDLEDATSHQRLELNWYPPRSRFASPYSVGEALDHLGFEVPDARATIRRLVRAGARIAVRPWREGAEWIGFVEDPDGIWIEITSRIRPRPPRPRGPESARASPGTRPLRRRSSVGRRRG